MLRRGLVSCSMNWGLAPEGEAQRVKGIYLSQFILMEDAFLHIRRCHILWMYAISSSYSEIELLISLTTAPGYSDHLVTVSLNFPDSFFRSPVCCAAWVFVINFFDKSLGRSVIAGQRVQAVEKMWRHVYFVPGNRFLSGCSCWLA